MGVIVESIREENDGQNSIMCQGLFRLDLVVQCGTDRVFQRDTSHLLILVASMKKS